MQELIGNMTVEQFTQFLGALIGGLCLFFGSWFLLHSLAVAIVDGWLFRKGALYYGSLRYLNKCFKNLKSATSIQLLDLANAELRSAIYFLRYQRIIPKIMYKRLLEKQEQLHYKRRSEIWTDEKDYNVFSY